MDLGFRGSCKGMYQGFYKGVWEFRGFRSLGLERGFDGLMMTRPLPSSRRSLGTWWLESASTCRLVLRVWGVRAQYPLIKQYALNYKVLHIMI